MGCVDMKANEYNLGHVECRTNTSKIKLLSQVKLFQSILSMSVISWKNVNQASAPTRIVGALALMAVEAEMGAIQKEYWNGAVLITWFTRIICWTRCSILAKTFMLPLSKSNQYPRPGFVIMKMNLTVKLLTSVSNDP